MKIWILGLVALLLLLWSVVRERFEATPSIKAPPYDAAEKIRLFEMARQTSPKPPYTYLGHQDRLMAKAKEQSPKEKEQTKLKEIAGGFVSHAVADFFTQVFRPATTPITDKEIKAFLASRSSDIKDIEEDILTTYFIGQSGAGTSARSGYAAMLAQLGQNAGYLVSNKPPGSEAGGDRRQDGGQQRPGEMGDRQGTGTQMGPSPPAMPPPRGSGGMAAVTSGTTTGGTSASSFGPNSGMFGGGGDRRKQIFGPIAMGRDETDDGRGAVPMDSSKTNRYPELLGGGDSKPSTRIEGAGIVPPSKSWQLSNDGSLPDPDSLKSQVPGDKDLIPDPYRVAQQFTSASYSFKTDPVPFLTDFSAFQR